MGYRKITNLDKNHPIFQFKECYSLLKIHGTSTSITFTRTTPADPWQYKVFSGGIKYIDFMAMLQNKYNLDEVTKKLAEYSVDYDTTEIVIYGEGYGGKCQKMSDVYGPLNFIAFEVERGGFWLDVERAAKFVELLGLPFVPFERGPATFEWLTVQRDKPDEQAKRNGLGDDKIGEGIVIRAPMEFLDQHGGRIVAKYKRPSFRETASNRELTDEKLKQKEDADEIAEEYVVEHRLDHVLGALVAKGHENLTIKDTSLVVAAMVDDVVLESAKEVAWSQAATKAVGRKAAMLFKQRLATGGIINPIDGTTADQVTINQLCNNEES